jgi:hypothetical protein
VRRCARERERGRQGGLGRPPLLSPSLSLRKVAERGTELWVAEGKPRCSSNQPRPAAASTPRRNPAPLQRHPAAPPLCCGRAPLRLRPAASPLRFGRDPVQPRPAASPSRCGRAPLQAAPSCISAPLQPRPATAASRCSRAQLHLRLAAAASCCGRAPLPPRPAASPPRCRCDPLAWKRWVPQVVTRLSDRFKGGRTENQSLRNLIFTVKQSHS